MIIQSMNLKTKIKNDLWRFNYIVPFIRKYRMDEKGYLNFAQNALNVFFNITPIKGDNKIRTVGDDIKALFSRVKIEISDKGFIYFLDVNKTIAVPGNIISNFTIDYKKILNTAFWDIVEKNKETNPNYNEIKLAAEGIDILRQRILDAIPSSQLSDTEKATRIYDFENMLIRPAESFAEGLQRILFFNQIMWQTRHRLNGLGRLDLYLNDLYLKDIEKKNITKEIAFSLIEDFLEKLSLYPNYKSDALEGDIGQIIILGGLNEDRTYFCNDLTYMFLIAQAKAKRPDPKILLRASQFMPQELMVRAVECLFSQTGSPLFSNDDVIIPSLIKSGIDPIDAYTYCTSACWEPFIVGKSFDQNNIAVFDYETAFDSIMDNKDVSTFEELIDRYIDINQKKFKDFLGDVDKLKWAKDPIVSILTDDCCERKKDISEGGARYSNYGITTVGLPNVINSLININVLVFEKQRFTLEELSLIRKNNFKDHEKLRIWCQQQDYFGIDDLDIIKLVNRITGSLSEIAVNYRNKLGGTVKFGLSSPGYNTQSKTMTADFSGRKYGEPYKTHISCDGIAYTELVNFSGGLEYNKNRYNGNVVDYFLNLDFLKENKEKFVVFMMNAIKAGFFQMQMNIMDSKTLIDAKDHPKKYPGLIVRVWGFSAYFNDLPESYKDLLIERAIKTEAN